MKLQERHLKYTSRHYSVGDPYLHLLVGRSLSMVLNHSSILASYVGLTVKNPPKCGVRDLPDPWLEDSWRRHTTHSIFPKVDNPHGQCSMQAAHGQLQSLVIGAATGHAHTRSWGRVLIGTRLLQWLRRRKRVVARRIFTWQKMKRKY